MTPEVLGQIGGAIGLILAAAVAAFRVGVRRGANGRNGGAPRWHPDDREFLRRIIVESNDALRDHLDTNTEALNGLRAGCANMTGFLQGRLSSGDD
jgi:hypothetical protein